MSEPQASQPSAKPGTACLGCRRRKLRCTREQDGCKNCLRSDLPCVYPAPETGVKRKRGPYRKDKPARERHLEDLVRYLEPKARRTDIGEATGVGGQVEGREENCPSCSHLDGSKESPRRRATDRGGENEAEDLVKDALVALTQSSAEKNEHTPEPNPPLPPPPPPVGEHPPIRRIFEYWHLFVRKVDPLLKILHCRTFEPTLLKALDNPQGIGPTTTALLFAVYHSAVASCTSHECRKRFGESREGLLQRYARVVEAMLAENHEGPSLEAVQALISIRTDDGVGNIRALFSLAVRMGRLIGLHEDPGDGVPAFEAEMRRRLWWHICGLESRGAEEGGARKTSIMDEGNVRLPLNLNDSDLRPECEGMVEARAGVTDVTFVLCRWETVRFVHRLFSIKKRWRERGYGVGGPELTEELREAVREHELRCDAFYRRHFDGSRQMDRICIQWLDLMKIKCRLIVEYPLGQVPTKEMTPQERHDLLRSSVDIIRLSHGMSTHKSIEDWLWYFRGWVQWHSVAIVIAELGGNRNQHFVDTAWSVLDPILAGWDRVYNAKRDEPAWIHVNEMIEKARRMRRRLPSGPRESVREVQRQDPTSAREVPPQQPDQLDHSRAMPSSVVGLVPDAAWQSQWDTSDGFGIPHDTNEPSYQQVSPPIPAPSPQSFPLYAISNTQVPFLTICAPPMQGFDWEGFGYIEGLDNIDFSAFDFVFKDMAWDFSSPSTDHPSVETSAPQ